MTKYNLIKGEKVALTADEEAVRVAEIADVVTETQAAADAKAQKATDKTNGNQKLLDLGLTQAEVDALTG